MLEAVQVFERAVSLGVVLAEAKLLVYAVDVDLRRRFQPLIGHEYRSTAVVGGLAIFLHHDHVVALGCH